MATLCLFFMVGRWGFMTIHDAPLIRSDRRNSKDSTFAVWYEIYVPPTTWSKANVPKRKSMTVNQAKIHTLSLAPSIRLPTHHHSFIIRTIAPWVQ